MKQYILFESRPDFVGSPLAIYNELIKRGYDKIYDLRWAVDKSFNDSKCKYRTIKFFNMPVSTRNSILANTKCIIDSNKYIHKLNKNTFRLHTRHGNNLKKLAKYSANIGDVDAMLCSSKMMHEIDKTIYPSSATNKSLQLGFPANDELFVKKDLYKNCFIQHLTKSEKTFNKIILWLPTYRQNAFDSKVRSNTIFKYGLPLINSENDLNKLNEVLKQHNTLLLYQIHHGQAHNYENIKHYCNIVHLTDVACKQFNVTLANIFNFVDALITDYSSAYYEFLMLNKPIALAIPDYVAYRTAFDFCIDYLSTIKGEFLVNLSHLYDFINDVAHDLDFHAQERNILLRKVYQFIDNNATKRVVDYLEKYALK